MNMERTVDDVVRTGAVPYSDAFQDESPADGRVEVVHGVYAHSLPLVGMTVGQARRELQERMNIAPAAMALIDGNEASEDTFLAEGQVLTFLTHSGEKGRAVNLSSAEV